MLTLYDITTNTPVSTAHCTKAFFLSNEYGGYHGYAGQPPLPGANDPSREWRPGPDMPDDVGYEGADHATA